MINVGRLETSKSSFSDPPDWKIATRSRDGVFTKASNFDMVHVGKERYWNIVDNMTEDVAGKLSYWSTRIVEVKIISVMNEELALEIWGWEEGYGKTYGREVTTRSFESALSRCFRPHFLCSRSLPRVSR